MPPSNNVQKLVTVNVHWPNIVEAHVIDIARFARKLVFVLFNRKEQLHRKVGCIHVAYEMDHGVIWIKAMSQVTALPWHIYFSWYGVAIGDFTVHPTDTSSQISHVYIIVTARDIESVHQQWDEIAIQSF